MINRNGKRTYAENRVSHTVDPNAQIRSGMVAFLGTYNGVSVATVAASGEMPIGTFWKDHDLSYIRSIVENGTFDANNVLTLSQGNVRSTAKIKVTSSTGTVYTQGVDYTVNITSGVVTRVGGAGITALATVVIWYEYSILASDISYKGGTNYDRVPDDTLGGDGLITVVEGWAHIFTDQYDVAQNYTVGASLRADANSLWTTATGLTMSSIVGTVLAIPTVSSPWLGVRQLPVAA